MPFDFMQFRPDINRVLEGDVPLVLRSRLKGVIIKQDTQPQRQQDVLQFISPDEPNSPDDSVLNSPSHKLSIKEERNHSSSSAIPNRTCFLVLNEIVIDRGMSSFLSNVDLYLNGRLITSVQVRAKEWLMKLQTL
jgi:NAD+ kinase